MIFSYTHIYILQNMQEFKIYPNKALTVSKLQKRPPQKYRIAGKPSGFCWTRGSVSSHAQRLSMPEMAGPWTFSPFSTGGDLQRKIKSQKPVGFSCFSLFSDLPFPLFFKSAESRAGRYTHRRRQAGRVDGGSGTSLFLLHFYSGWPLLGGAGDREKEMGGFCAEGRSRLPLLEVDVGVGVALASFFFGRGREQCGGFSPVCLLPKPREGESFGFLLCRER